MDSHHTPFSGSPLFSKQVRLARPVDIPNWSAWGDLHSQGCSGLSRTGLLFPANHTPVGDPGLAPGRLGDLKSPGSAIPSEASRREMVGMKGLAPPRLPDSESGPSAIRVKPHARKLVHPAGLPPANSPFEAEDDNKFHHGCGNGGSPRCCPVLCGLRDRCIAAMLATRSRHEGGVEPPRQAL